MKLIKSFRNIEHIIDSKLDVYDEQDHLIHYVRFLMMPLADIINQAFGKLKYAPEM